jgi:Protein of unknown function (DUF3305)
MRVGIVLERRRIANPWQEHAWRAVAVVPGAAGIAAPRLLGEGEGWAQYHAATLDIELFPRDTEGYRCNLSQAPPVVYALWRSESEDPEGWPAVFHVTVCPYEAQDYLDGADVMVEGVRMPDAIAHWVAGYVARHHVDEPFRKRRRTPQPGGERRNAIDEDGLG